MSVRPRKERACCNRHEGLQEGFARLGELYFERTHKILLFIPLAIQARLRQVRAGNPIAFNRNNARMRERIGLALVLEAAIRAMLIHMTTQGYVGIPLPR